MLGWPEILLILMVMLLVFGPSKLPEMARSLGQAFKEFQSATATIEKEAKIMTDSLPDLNGGLQMNATSVKKKALENRRAMIANAAKASKAIEPTEVVATPPMTESHIPPMPPASKAKDESLTNVAKMLGISVEGRSEEDLKTAIHDRIEGLDKKEV